MAANKVEAMSLSEQAQEILNQAQQSGVHTNFFFQTTFKRYQVQMKIMTDLEQEINELGATVKKEYVKGRQNVYTNPAIAEYNKTANAANQTVSTLLNILKAFKEEDAGKELSMAEIMNELMKDE